MDRSLLNMSIEELNVKFKSIEPGQRIIELYKIFQKRK